MVGAFAMLVVTWPVAAAAAGRVPTPGLLLNALRGGWWRALTTVPPLGADPQVLLAVSAATALAAFFAVEAALRTRGVLVVALPPFVLFVLGLLAGGPGSDLVVAIGLAFGTAALAAVSAGPRRSIRGLAAAIPAGAAVAIVTAAAFAAGSLPTSRTPFDPRRWVHPAAFAHSAVNPLDQASGWLAAPDAALFTVSADGPAAPTTMRLAVLDRFDGQEWTSTAGYTATGSRVPAAASAPAVSTERVNQSVTLDSLDTLWLPAATRPTGIDAPGSALAVDPDGDLLIAAGTHPGLTYRVTSAVPQYSTNELRSATPVPDSAALALPGDVPAVITDTAQTATAGAGFPYQQASFLAGYLRSHAAFDPQAASGHSYGHIAYFLSTSHRGGSEQFAAAFALMARSLGLPTRIAVGFAIPSASAAGPTPITGSDTLIWPEVKFSGLGWVPFFPTPSGTAHGGTAQPAIGENTARQQSDADLAATKLPPPRLQTPGQPVSRSGASGSVVSSKSGLPWWAEILIALATAVVLYLGFVLVVPALRRNRLRRHADPSRAVLGAWSETVVLLRALGLDDTATRTTPQIAGYGSALLTDDAARALHALADFADRAAFAAEPPPAAVGADAWAAYDVVRSAVRGATTFAARSRHQLMPRFRIGRI